MKTIEICVEIKRETDRAFLVNDGGNDSWIPKSQITTDQDYGPGDTAVLELPEWLAIEKGFV